MELQPVDNTIIIPQEEQAETVPFAFVSALLAMTLSGQNDELIFELEEFLCAPKTGIEATASITAEFDSEDVAVTEDEIEITLSGKVENQQGRKEVFILYFFMRLNRAANFSMMNGCTKNPGTHPLVIQFENEEEQLNDAVFELSLYQTIQSGRQQPLGQVKGFLFVGQDKSTRVN